MAKQEDRVVPESHRLLGHQQRQDLRETMTRKSGLWLQSGPAPRDLHQSRLYLPHPTHTSAGLRTGSAQEDAGSTRTQPNLRPSCSPAAQLQSGTPGLGGLKGLPKAQTVYRTPGAHPPFPPKGSLSDKLTLSFATWPMDSNQ